MASVEKDRVLELRGGDLADRDGRKIGRIEEIYLHPESAEPEWAVVHTGLLGTGRTFVPLAGCTEDDGRLRVPLAQETVEDAPRVEPNGRLTQDEAAALRRHYGSGEAGRA